MVLHHYYLKWIWLCKHYLKILYLFTLDLKVLKVPFFIDYAFMNFILKNNTISGNNFFYFLFENRPLVIGLNPWVCLFFQVSVFKSAFSVQGTVSLKCPGNSGANILTDVSLAWSSWSEQGLGLESKLVLACVNNKYHLLSLSRSS